MTAKVKAKKAVTPKIKREVKPATPAPATKPEVVSRQQLAINALLAGVKEQGVKVDDKMVTMDGKYGLVRPWGPAPTIKVGPQGSYDIVEVKSFQKADLPTMLKAKEMYDKQVGREAKRTAAAVAAAKPPAAQPEQPKAETPTGRKQKADQQLE